MEFVQYSNRYEENQFSKVIGKSYRDQDDENFEIGMEKIILNLNINLKII